MPKSLVASAIHCGCRSITRKKTWPKHKTFIWTNDHVLEFLQKKEHYRSTLHLEDLGSYLFFCNYVLWLTPPSISVVTTPKAIVNKGNAPDMAGDCNIFIFCVCLIFPTSAWNGQWGHSLPKIWILPTIFACGYFMRYEWIWYNMIQNDTPWYSISLYGIYIVYIYSIYIYILYVVYI